MNFAKNLINDKSNLSVNLIFAFFPISFVLGSAIVNLNFFVFKSLFQDGRKLSQLYASFLIPVPPFPITNGYIRRHLEDIFMYPTGLLCGGLEGLSLA